MSTLSVTIVILCCFYIACDADSLLKRDEDDAREAKEYIPEAWHAIQTVPEGATGWIPRDPVNGAVVSIRKRRLRKRKRRPPIVSYLDPNADSVANTQPENDKEIFPDLTLEVIRYDNEKSENILNKTPNIGDPWVELQEESIKPYSRRKVPPTYENSENDTSISTKADSNPLSASIRFNNADEDLKYSNGKSTTEAYNLTPKTSLTIKEILKQNDGLSLSEILQKKNITLSELLNGNKEAIKALTKTSEIVSTTQIPLIDSVTKKNSIPIAETTKYKRLPPSIAMRKNSINRRYQQYADSSESLSDQEIMEAQRKRVDLLKGYTLKGAQNGKFSGVTRRYEVVTEPTTEQRIFVPSHPALYTSVNYKPDIEDLTFNTGTVSSPNMKTSATTSTTTEKIVIQKSTSKRPIGGLTKGKVGLPITSAKLNKMTTKKFTSTPKDIASRDDEKKYQKMNGMTLEPYKISIEDVFGLHHKADEKLSDEPLRMSIDLDKITDSSTAKPVHSTSSTRPIKDVPKLQPYTAKDEILEILKDPRDRLGLARILEARNMTIQELIEQRERGSSQVHLADIFHNKTREPEPTEEEAFEGKMNPEVFTSFPLFFRRPKELTEHKTSSENPIESTVKESNTLFTAFPAFKIETNKENTESSTWKQYDVQKNSQESSESMPHFQPVDILTEEYIHRLEDIDQDLYASASNEEMNIIQEQPQKILNISSGVKSAIIASLAITAISMIVFVTILIVFRWSQRKKKRLHYGDGLKPRLFDEKRRSIKTIVTGTLGNKQGANYYKRHLQSMSDDSWERGNERKNVF